MEKILRIEKIEKYYGNKNNITKAVDNISFDVNGGEFVAIMGASGSGKSTLLNCISTIDKVTSGHIYLKDADITKLKGYKLTKFRRDSLGFIFQDFNLLDTLTSFENIALALTIQKSDYKILLAYFIIKYLLFNGYHILFDNCKNMKNFNFDISELVVNSNLKFNYKYNYVLDKCEYDCIYSLFEFQINNHGHGKETGIVSMDCKWN